MRPQIEQLRPLAMVSSDPVPALSAYLDLRPNFSGNPTQRIGAIVLRDRLRDIERNYAERLDHDQRQELAALAAAMRDWAEHDCPADAGGAALFAAPGFFAAYPLPTAFDNHVSADSHFDLSNIAAAIDDRSSAVVAVADSSTLRLLLRDRSGRWQSLPGLDEPADNHTKAAAGAWSQQRYERHIEWHDEQFAARILERLGQVMARYAPARWLLAAEEETHTRLLAKAPAALRDLYTECDLRAELYASEAEIIARATACIKEIVAAERERLVETAVGEAAAGDLGAVGAEQVAAMLRAGAVDTLLLDAASDLDPAVRAELTRAAVETGARIEVTRECELLQAHGGTSAILRFRPPAVLLRDRGLVGSTAG